MTPEELAELDCHLAAGTDLPTALAALPQNERRGKSIRHDRAFQAGLWLGLLAMVAYGAWRLWCA